MEDDKSALLVYIFLLVYGVQVLTIACVSVRLCVTLSVKYVHLFPFSPISPDQPMHSVLSAQISSCIQSVQPRSAPEFSLSAQISSCIHSLSPDQPLLSVLSAQISPEHSVLSASAYSPVSPCIQSCQPQHSVLSAPAFSPVNPSTPSCQPLHSVLSAPAFSPVSPSRQSCESMNIFVLFRPAC